MLGVALGCRVGLQYWKEVQSFAISVARTPCYALFLRFLAAHTTAVLSHTRGTAEAGLRQGGVVRTSLGARAAQMHSSATTESYYTLLGLSLCFWRGVC